MQQGFVPLEEFEFKFNITVCKLGTADPIYSPLNGCRFVAWVGELKQSALAVLLMDRFKISCCNTQRLQLVADATFRGDADVRFSICAFVVVGIFCFSTFERSPCCRAGF